MMTTSQNPPALTAQLLPSAKYLGSGILVGLFIVSLLNGGWWTWSLPLFVFGLIPLVELVLPGSTVNMSEEEEASALSNRVYDGILYGIVPVQYGLLAVYLWRITTGALAWWEILGLTFSMGIMCGAFGINVAHELGHRKTWYEQWMSKALLLTALYMHFFVEHNRGHHSNVATDDDPATARDGETVYAFWRRSVVDSWKSGWEIESRRVLRKYGTRWTWHNEMLWYVAIQVGFCTSIALVFGLSGLLAFVTVAVIGFLMLETVNYIEHYGLRRAKRSNGRYEHVMPHHSWNSDHPLGRVLLFELTRHSDHHAHASRPYQVLRHFEQSPQLPTGYPGMMVLSLIPPAYFAVMQKALEHHRTLYGGLAEDLDGKEGSPSEGEGVYSAR